MANWGVVVAHRPVVNRPKQKHRHHVGTPTSPVVHMEPRHQENYKHDGNVFKLLCQDEDGQHDCFEQGCERITINVSGLQFITRRSILEEHPTTLLGNPEKRKPYYDHMREEYFFDRHRVTFESIFNYYLYGGKLKRPPSVADDIFLDECEFFEVEEQVVKDYKQAEGYTETIHEYPDNPILAKIWGLFEYPETSKLAFFIGIVSVIATLVSIVTFTLETLPRFHKNCTAEELEANTFDEDIHNQYADPYIYNSSQSYYYQPPEPKKKDFDFEKFFFVIESLCNAWFTLEAVIRFISCPSKIGFWKDVKNIIDIIAIVPYYVAVGQMMSADAKCDTGNDFAFLRVIRLIRVFKLTKHSQGLQILLLTFQSSIEGLTLFVLTLMVCILVFSSTIYYCEIGEKDTMIKSIPGGFWWAVITMCTVGYGDVVPVGPYGKIVGTLCSLSGLLTLAIPVPIITENFNKFYVHKQRSPQKNRDIEKPSLLEKAHDQVVKAASCCSNKMGCREDRSGDPAEI